MLVVYYYMEIGADALMPGYPNHSKSFNDISIAIPSLS